MYTIYEIGIGIASLFLGMALIAFWKRALHMKINVASTEQVSCCQQKESQMRQLLDK